MRTAHFFALVLLLLFCPSLLGQHTFFIGTEVTKLPNAADRDAGTPRTDIDLTRPAMATGTVSSANVYWGYSSPMPGCTPRFKVKFFRRVGDRLTMTAERGPFNPTDHLNTVTLAPPVPVEEGDLIGITNLTPCGSPTVFKDPSEGYLQYDRDVMGTVEMTAAVAHPGDVLAIGGAGDIREVAFLVIPVVGSGPGAFGSFFRTEVQFFKSEIAFSNPYIFKLVFRRAGVPGSSADPTLAVAICPGEVFSVADIVAEMGETGLGSLDLIVPRGPTFELAVARIYNDAGSAGTSGLTEEGMVASEEEAAFFPRSTLLQRREYGYLVTPRQPDRTRCNVGVRTLHSGATIEVTLRDSHGIVIRRKTHRFTATYFIQMPVQDFVGGPITGSESMQIHVTSGSAFVYSTTTDNVTNDPSIQFTRRIGTM